MPASLLEADVVVIGSGFGGTMTALTIAHKLHPPELRDAQNQLRALLKDDPTAQQPATQNQRKLVADTVVRLTASGALKRIVILERGTWWTTPVPTVQDSKIQTPKFLEDRGQPVQYWSSLDHFKGVVDLFTRCFRRRKFGPFPGNEDGLYDISHMGRKGFLGLIGNQNDGLSVLRACGVGGGSLVYSNITVRPPEFIFDGWDTTWTKTDRDTYYELAKHAIGYGILLAWSELGAGNIPYHTVPNVAGAVNTGLSNVSAQTARLDPHWETEPDSFLPTNSPRSVKRLGADSSNWLTRARVFQTAMKAIRLGGYHTVDSSINDLTPESTSPTAPPIDPLVPHNHPPNPAFPKSANYCERQGRCTLGCLPGARHTLNKQLMGAGYGKPTDPIAVPQFPNLEIRALAEADVIRPAGDGWTVHYFERNAQTPAHKTPRQISAKRVIVAAGCLGSNELLLRSRDDSLPNLSPRLGEGFSTNGDYLAFLEGIKEPVNLSRGPVQTSVAHFNDRPGENTAQFHIVEDQGIPKALATTVNYGLKLIRALTYQRRLRLWLALLMAITRRVLQNLSAMVSNARQRQELFKSEEELTLNMMAVTASGRDQATGKFRLGGGWGGESTLRVTRTNGVPFHQDPIFAIIDATLNGPDGKSGLAAQLLPPDKIGKEVFRNPFLSDTVDKLAGKSVTITHPLGGCRIGKDASRGVVDEFGRVYDASGPEKYYPGLYVADAAIIPSALGVNPSLTISALALRIGERIAAEMNP